MSVTDEVFHAEMSRSKAEAPRNISDMSVTDEVFHAEMSRSKAETSRNMDFMEATPDRSGASIALYVIFEAS